MRIPIPPARATRGGTFEIQRRISSAKSEIAKRSARIWKRNEQTA
jgi:hypothetical protein